MTAWNPSTARIAQARVASTSADSETVRSGTPWQQLFRPCTLAFFGLAIAITLWGYGYKLSLYLHLPDSEQIPVAKMWIEHRHGHLDLSVVLPPRHKAATPLSLGAQPVSTPDVRLAGTGWIALVIANPIVAHAHLVSPNSLRSPPSLHSSLL
jgi:hypothetical protein